MATTKPQFSKIVCDTGLTHFRCEGLAPIPAKLVGKLAQRCPGYLLVDPAAAGLDLPVEAQPRYLFDWVAVEFQPEHSPCVLRCAADAPETLDLIKQAWGKEILICLYSKKPPEEVAGKLREMIRVGGEPGQVPRGVLGICWPDSLEAILRDGRKETVERLFSFTDVVMLASPDHDRWQAFSRPEFAMILTNLGFEETAPTNG